jgi:surface protein
MAYMFNGAKSFNQNIGSWNTAVVTNMADMFFGATAFNQNIGAWNTAAVTDMSAMFSGATAFNQNIGAWTLNAQVNLANMLNICGMDCSNYSSTLIGWNKSAPKGKALGATSLYYNIKGKEAKANLILSTIKGGKGWKIIDAGIFDNCGALVPKQ